MKTKTLEELDKERENLKTIIERHEADLKSLETLRDTPHTRRVQRSKRRTIKRLQGFLETVEEEIRLKIDDMEREAGLHE